jgi:hypothetical protein
MNLACVDIQKATFLTAFHGVFSTNFVSLSLSDLVHQGLCGVSMPASASLVPVDLLSQNPQRGHSFT